MYSFYHHLTVCGDPDYLDLYSDEDLATSPPIGALILAIQAVSPQHSTIQFVADD